MKFSAFIYRTMLLLYPEDLRIAFGNDMTAAFTEDLASVWLARDAFGIAALWWCAAFEVATIAVPGRLASRALKTGAISIAVHIAVMGGILALVAIQETMPAQAWHGVVKLHLRPSTERR